MITITNQRRYTQLEWDQYVVLPGKSYSSLRNPDPIPFTSKMRLGKLVDQYLFTPNEYKGEMRDVVRPLASAVRSFLGSALDHATPQLAVTCDMTYEGLTMSYRGLIDLPVGKDLIVDMKVSELDPVKAIQYFRYDRQISGYMLAYGAKRGVVISINPKTKKISTLPIPLVTDWWEYQIKLWGKPTTQTLPLGI